MWTYILISLSSVSLGLELPSPGVTLSIYHSKDLPNCFPRWKCTTLHSLQPSGRLRFLHVLASSCHRHTSDPATPVGMRWPLAVVLLCSCRAVFPVLLRHSGIFSGETSVQIRTFCCWALRVLWIFCRYLSLIRYTARKCFSHSVGGLFTLLMASFEAQIFTTSVDPTYQLFFGCLHFG